MFTGRESVPILFLISGAIHLDDLLYLFPQDYIFRNSKLTPEDEHMVETMTTLWVNFARTGYVILNVPFGA
jgi:carboxylesterase type B